ncbi:MAG: hypothetical protein WAV05_14200 [Anaerolineales bacterium]
MVTFPEGVMLYYWDLGGGTAHVTRPENAAGSQWFVAVVDGIG